ncbi:MAG: hypothetical protein ABIN18_26635 [Pseudomonadota bacterium]
MVKTKLSLIYIVILIGMVSSACTDGTDWPPWIKKRKAYYEAIRDGLPDVAAKLNSAFESKLCKLKERRQGSSEIEKKEIDEKINELFEDWRYAFNNGVNNRGIHAFKAFSFDNARIIFIHKIFPKKATFDLLEKRNSKVLVRIKYTLNNGPWVILGEEGGFANDKKIEVKGVYATKKEAYNYNKRYSMRAVGIKQLKSMIIVFVQYDFKHHSIFRVETVDGKTY